MPNPSIILGIILILTGGGFEVARHDVSAQKDSLEAHYDSHLRSAQVYLNDGFRFQGQADWEVTHNGKSSTYQSLEESAAENIGLGSEQNTIAYNDLNSARSLGDKERLYKSISISALSIGGILIVEGIVWDLIKDKRVKAVAKHFEFRPTEKLDGGELVLVRRF